MSSHRTSYWKTLLAAGFAGVSVLALTLLLTSAVAPAHTVLRGLVVVVGSLTTLPLLSIVLSGLVVLYRDTTLATRRPDLFRSMNESRWDPAFAAGGRDAGLTLRRWARTLLGRDSLVVGDEVEIRPFEEIRRTLDDADCLDGLPFMPEMLRFCGQRARVFRRVDKIYDYGGKKVLRRMKSTVLLHRMRCDGASHGGCQADCSVLWKEAWLKPVSSTESAPVRQVGVDASQLLKPQSSVDHNGMTTYRCQYTQLVAASSPLKYWDPRGDFRPLAAGNLTLRAFAVALLTRLFNYVQGLRGGIAFPAMSHGVPPGTPAETRDLGQGDLVRVRPAQQIFQTLDKNSKNRGLWFDRDMVKHCGHDYEVSGRVDRIIDDATGLMRTMKTPCIILHDVNYSGEFLRFLAQEEHLYWREAWLSPLGTTATVTANLVAGNV